MVNRETYLPSLSLYLYTTNTRFFVSHRLLMIGKRIFRCKLYCTYFGELQIFFINPTRKKLKICLFFHLWKKTRKQLFLSKISMQERFLQNVKWNLIFETEKTDVINDKITSFSLAKIFTAHDNTFRLLINNFSNLRFILKNKTLI